jgi:hypothetical protein
MTAVYGSLADLHYSFVESILTSAALTHLVLLLISGESSSDPESISL